jgi:hypothetical protein
MRNAWLPLTLLPVLASAQSWCPPGAEWTYEYIDQMFNSGVHRIEHTGDTLIDGHQAQRLTHWVHYGGGWGQPALQTAHWNDLFTYEENGVVFLKSDWFQGFDTVMWFSAAPGDRWDAPGIEDWAFVVLDTTTILLDGLPLRQLIVQMEPQDLFPVDTLRERIGFQWFFINPVESMLIDGNYAGLRCYQDDELFHAMPNVSDCGYTMSVQAGAQEPRASIFPNPGTDHFNVALPPGAHVIRLCDAIGRELLNLRALGPNVRVDTAIFLAGIYFIGVDDQRPERWVKE